MYYSNQITTIITFYKLSTMKRYFSPFRRRFAARQTTNARENVLIRLTRTGRGRPGSIWYDRLLKWPSNPHWTFLPSFVPATAVSHWPYLCHIQGGLHVHFRDTSSFILFSPILSPTSATNTLIELASIASNLIVDIFRSLIGSGYGCRLLWNTRRIHM